MRCQVLFPFLLVMLTTIRFIRIVDSAGVFTAFVPLSWLSQQWLAEEEFRYSAAPLVQSVFSVVSTALVMGMLLPPQVVLPTCNLSVFSGFQSRAATLTTHSG